MLRINDAGFMSLDSLGQASVASQGFRNCLLVAARHAIDTNGRHKSIKVATSLKAISSTAAANTVGHGRYAHFVGPRAKRSHS